MLKMWVFSRKIFWQWIEVILRLLQLLEESRLEEGWKRGCKELSLDATRLAGPEGKRSGQIWRSNWQDLFLHWTPTSCWVCLSYMCSSSDWLCLSENQLRRLSTKQTKAVSAAVWLFWSHRHGLNNSLILSIDSASTLVSVELDIFHPTQLCEGNFSLQEQHRERTWT